MFEMCLFPKADKKVSGKWEVSPRRTDDQRKETTEMKYLVIGLVLIFIALYLVMLYSLLIMSARSDEVMRQLMEKEWMEKNEAEKVNGFIAEKE